jgi:glycosyltransferase involved in cell wall biosynthesis
MAKLSVVIPTKNEKNNLLNIATALIESLKGIDHQIIISNNSDRNLNISFSNLEVKQLKTPEIFITAEQHIFWLIEQVTGEYIWFLGDDDIPLKEGIKQLVKIVNKGGFDCFVFNGIRDNPQKKKSVRMINNNKKYEGKIKYFYANNGLVNGPASISLYVIKKELLAKRYLSEIQELNAPIYGHLILFLRSLSNTNFAFHPINIIKHRQSDVGQNKEFSSNWIMYAKESGNIYHFPWTLGLLRNINYLIKKGSIEKEFLSTIVESDPRNRKYQLLPQIEDYIRQIFVSKKNHSREITENELLELKKYLTEIQGFSEEIRYLVSSKDPYKEIIKIYPHMNPKVRNLRHKLVVFQYAIAVVFKQRVKDGFWNFVTKIWRYVPKYLKPFLRKFKHSLRKLK